MLARIIYYIISRHLGKILIDNGVEIIRRVAAHSFLDDIELASNSIVMLGISVKLSGRVESYYYHIFNCVVRHCYINISCILRSNDLAYINQPPSVGSYF